MNHVQGIGAPDDFREPGPIDVMPTVGTMAAKVISPGSAPRVYGYDTQSDLAVHYTFIESAYLSLTGKLPDPGTSRALDVVATFVGPLLVGSAPTHVAMLTRLCGAGSGAVVASATIAIAERAHQMVEHCIKPYSDANNEKATENQSLQRACVERFIAALAPFSVPDLTDQSLSIEQAAVLVLRECGFRTNDSILTFFVMVSIPFAAAEAFAATPGEFGKYPLRLPDFEYVGSQK